MQLIVAQMKVRSSHFELFIQSANTRKEPKREKNSRAPLTAHLWSCKWTSWRAHRCPDAHQSRINFEFNRTMRHPKIHIPGGFIFYINCKVVSFHHVRLHLNLKKKKMEVTIVINTCAHLFQCTRRRSGGYLRNQYKRAQPASSSVHIERMDTMEEFEKEEQRLTKKPLIPW